MKMSRFFILALILTLVLAAVGCAASAEESLTRRIGVVSGGSLKLREKPDTNAEIIQNCPKGTQVNIQGVSGGWYYVEVAGRHGYMMAKYVETTREYTHRGWAVAREENGIVNVFSSPDTASDIVAKCAGGTRFEVTSFQDGWVGVRSGLLFAYVQESDLRLTDEDCSSVTCLSGGPMRYTLESTGIRTSVHQAGNQRSMSSSSGGLSCTARYPIFALGRTDAALSSCVHELIRFATEDHSRYHTDTRATLDISYASSQYDSRYVSVILLSTYAVEGAPSLTTVRAFMIDTENDAVLKGADMVSDPDAVLFQLEAKFTRIFGDMTGGYASPGDLDWLSHAVLDRDGLSFYFQAGEILPIDAGMQKITLPYLQCSDLLAVSSQVIRDAARSIDPSKPMLALTFDDGPSEETLRILDVLEEYGGRATFCVVGNRLNQYSNVLRCIAAQENEIASHTWSHQKLTDLSASQIRSQLVRVNDLVFELTGKQVRVLRCPYGSFNTRVRNICAEMDMVIASWKVDTLDWSTRNTNKTYRSILNESESGYIVLMHDLYATTADAVIKAVPELISRGYQLVTVSELLSFHRDGAVPGTAYIRLDPENLKTD